jgi:hypothetical protein
MAVGEGKYDDLLTEVRLKAGAEGAALMIFDPRAKSGWGFSIQALPSAMLDLPKVLRYMADEIERDIPKDIWDAIIEKERKEKET